MSENGGSMPRTASVSVRRYRPGDYGDVLRLWNRAGGIHVSPSDSSSELERARKRDPDLFLVAEVAGRAVGVVLGRFDGRRGWINHLAVEPELQGRGVGRRLVHEVERRLLRKGCPKVNLHVLPTNRRALDFYAQLGYRPRDLVFVEKWLRPPRPARADRRGSSRRGPSRRSTGPPAELADPDRV
jgi:ribosomal protein S18 acetylase RimI-like enzyme